MVPMKSVRGFISLLIFFTTLVQRSEQYTYYCNTQATCGCSTVSATVNRIVGGEVAGTASWGWMISLSKDGYFICGGAVISANWIVTAAHCVKTATASQLRVYAGSNIQLQGQARSISRIIVHPSYSSSSNANDIALLQLNTPFDMSDSKIKPICVSSVSSSILSTSEWPTPGLYAVATGWGRTSESGSTSTYLQQVTLQLISNSNTDCGSIVSTVYKNYMFCAGYAAGGKDTCQGDSGGPLVMYTTSNQWILVGVTSFGYGCARPNKPGVYTRVAYYTSWISSMTSGSLNILTIVKSNVLDIPGMNTTIAITTRPTTNNPTTRPTNSTTRPVSSTTRSSVRTTTNRPINSTTTTSRTTSRPTTNSTKCIVNTASHKIPVWFNRR